MQKPDPIADPGSAPYWEGLKSGKLLLKSCNACGMMHFYPRELCPHCYSDDLDWKEAKGTGEIYSYTVAHRAAGPAFTDDVPYAVAVVTLDEGPRMLTRILGDSHSVRIGQRVQVSLQSTDGGWVLPFFAVVA